ncbi:MAG: 3'-5' exonuclease, partial [Kangiellaceae bacterium]|nr:3'-5' exonuclease [Kangiellaceae bacterium]
HLDDNSKNSQQKTLAILVRNKSHSDAIIHQLNQRQLPYVANDLFRLANQQLSQDLLSLLFVLLEPTDDLSWIALLRSPVMGAELSDLVQLKQQLNKISFAQALTSCEWIEENTKFNPSFKQRLLNFHKIFCQAQIERCQKPFEKWFHSILTATGFNQVYHKPSEQSDVDELVSLFAQYCEGATLSDRNQLEQAIEAKHAASDPTAGTQVQIMTMHKAKGLEFDTVVIPQLHKTINNRHDELILWKPMLDDEQVYQLMVGMRSAKGSEHKDPMFDYLANLDKLRGSNEVDRLLYVATTRAKSRLVLTAEAEWDVKKDELKLPTPSQLLSRLWPSIGDSFQLHHAHGSTVHEATPLQRIKRLNNTPLDTPLRIYQEPPATDAIETTEPIDLQTSQYQLQLGDEAVIGKIIHKILEHCNGVSQRLNVARVANVYGVYDSVAIDNIQRSVQRMLEDKDGQWILAKHEQAANELINYRYHQDYRSTHIIDRTFIDQDVRWIIDYKSSQPDPSEPTGQFIEQQVEIYQPQLKRYAELFESEGLQIRAALYFTAIPKLVTVEL